MKNLKKTVQMAVMTGFGLALSACALHKPTGHQEICDQLQRQLTYYKSQHDIEASWTTAPQRAQYMQKIRDNHCDQN